MNTVINIIDWICNNSWFVFKIQIIIIFLLIFALFYKTTYTAIESDIYKEGITFKEIIWEISNPSSKRAYISFYCYPCHSIDKIYKLQNYKNCPTWRYY